MEASNLIPNGDFARGRPGGMPEGWSVFSPQPYLAPRFSVIEEKGKTMLAAAGNGNENCVGWARASVPLTGGRTYRMKVRFTLSPELDPYQNLLISFWIGREWNDGVFAFRRVAGDDHAYEGIRSFAVPGEGAVDGEVRLAFRLAAGGEARFLSVALTEAEPIPERNLRAACVQGYTSDLGIWERVVDRAAELGADLVLLPETFTGDDAKDDEQPIDGECPSFLKRMSEKHGIYMAGSFLHRDAADGHLYNTCLLVDRQGKTVGRYDKIHPYSPEMLHDGVTPGSEVPVFRTEFGTVGVMICYDYWFPDISELLALKGAEVILFPNAGQYRSIIPARAADNGVRVVCSSMYGRNGVWDTSGADVEAPELDPTRFAGEARTFKDVVREKVAHIDVLAVTLDLNQSPSPHNWGGPMMSAPGGRRNRREQKRLLYDDIQAEMRRLDP